MEMQGKRQGLTTKQATKLQFEHGENRLTASKKVSPLKIFCGQFKDLMTIILLASTVVSLIMGEHMEAVAIVVIVFLNAVLGFTQEYRTEKTLEALKNMAAPSARVRRDGKNVTIPASEIVPGDIVLLSAGDKVPADARLVEVVSLQCDESLLSGESLPVEKQTGRSPIEIAKLEAGRSDMVYMGTIVTKGRGEAEVVATGMKTEMGKIAGMLHTIEEDETPLQKRLAQLGKYIAVGCLAICAVVATTGILRGEPIFDMLITGISLAVAAVPEGLPAIVTIALALAVNRILKRKALVRKLHSVETMGCANVICTDKTGTLTENKMTVRRLYTMDHQVQVSGNGHEQAGEFSIGGRRASIIASPVLKRLMEIATQCNNAQITMQGSTAMSRDRTASTSKEKWQTDGEPTEIALLVMAAKANVLQEDPDFHRLSEIPFDSERKRMSVMVRHKSGKTMAFAKGAPDLLLNRCKYIQTDSGIQSMTPAHKRRIEQENQIMAKDALRVLGFAYKDAPSGNEDAERDMVFVGLVGMMDPPRKEAYEAVSKCRQAKIRTVMITGDHKDTACAIAKDLGIMRGGDKVMTGAELDALPQQEFEQIVHKVSVFARVSPGHKLKIVQALKKRGDIVAMTGDGVNDAPAVKEADIGVSMGISGTDVTKQAASIILLDDNFATLVAAIEEGRVVYANIRKFIRYLLSCNIGEVVTMFVGMLMGLPVVLLPIQILLVNLATDGLPAIALGLEPGEPDIMTRKPRPANDSVFSGGLAGTIVFRGCIIGLTTLLVFTSLVRHSGLDAARTGALLALVMTQLFHVFECKSENKGIFQINTLNNPSLIGAVLISFAIILFVIYNPWAQVVFSTQALTITEMLRVMGYSMLAPLLSAIIKMRPQKVKNDLPVLES